MTKNSEHGSRKWVAERKSTFKERIGSTHPAICIPIGHQINYSFPKAVGMTTSIGNEFLQEILRDDGDLWQVLREDLRWDRERYVRFCDKLEKALRGSSVHDVVPRAIV